MPLWVLWMCPQGSVIDGYPCNFSIPVNRICTFMCKRRKCHFIYDNFLVRRMSLSESTWLIYTFILYIVCVWRFFLHIQKELLLFNYKNGSTVTFWRNFFSLVIAIRGNSRRNLRVFSVQRIPKFPKLGANSILGIVKDCEWRGEMRWVGE